MPAPRATIQLLGTFRVTVDGNPVDADQWPARRAAELVQLLALADRHRLAREQVIEALWPHLDVEAGAANLRKAAHNARRALDDADAVVLRAGQVELFPAGTVETDADRFSALAAAALATDDPSSCTAAAAAYDGDLLPGALYEGWTGAARDRLRSTYLDLLRRSGQWERLVEVEPTDEPAYRELIRRELDGGSRPAAIRWYGRLRTALRAELAISPSEKSVALYERCVAGLGSAEPAFLGRQLELARIEALLRAGGGSEVALLAIRGPGGIGKSAFCRQIARIARTEGRQPIFISATEVGGPYAPLAALTEGLVARDERLLESVGDQAEGILTQLTSPATATPQAESALTRHGVIGAVRRLLLASADGRSVVLVVDDAHLADDATIDVLQHLHAATGPSILVVLSFRPEAAPETVLRAVARLARAGRALEIDLGPLDPDEAAALVAAGASTPRDEDTIGRIVGLGEGSPFLTLELARSAVVGVPALTSTVRDAIASRFLDLDDPTIGHLRALALAGDDLDPASAAAVVAGSEEQAMAALDAALETAVLVVADGRYRFRHELVRQALIEQIAPHRRTALHRETAERLGRVGAEPGLIAHHWLAGEQPDAAIDWQLGAAREAVRLGAFADALNTLEPLLAHQPEHGEALRLRAFALDARGDAAAPRAYAAAAEVVGGPEADDLRAMGALATVKLGDAPGGLRALDGLQPTTLDGRVAHALGFAGAAALGFGDPAVGTEKAAEARRLAFESGQPGAIAVASWAQAAAAHARGELRESVQADLDDTSALPALALNAFDGQLCITQRLLYGARPYADVIAFANALEAEAERLGAARGRAFAVTIRGEAKLLAGQLDDAEADLIAGGDLHRRMGAGTGVSFALQRRAELALHRGDHARAVALLDEALAIARESDVGFHLFDRIYGTRIIAARDPAGALAALEEAEEAVRGPVETCPGCRITFAVPAAIAATQAGDRKRADEWLQISEYLVKVVMRLPAWDAAFDEINGHRAQADGDPETARGHFRTAAEGFGAAEHPLDEARCASLAAA